MKRPLMIVGFTYLFSLACCTLLSEIISLWLGVIFLLTGVLFIVFRSTRKDILFQCSLLTVSTAFFVFFIVSQAVVAPVKMLDGQKPTVTARLVDLPSETENGYTYSFESSMIELDNAPQKVKFRIYTQNALDIEPYDIIVTQLEFLHLDKYSAVEYTNKFLSKGEYISAYLTTQPEDVTIIKGGEKDFYYYAIKVRKYVKDKMGELFSKDVSALVTAILIGGRNGLDDTIYTNLRISGVIHAISVSGLHVSILSAFVVGLLKFFGIRRKYASVFVIICNFCFMAVTGFVPCIVRAGLMLILYNSAFMFKREADSLNSLGFSVLVILLMNPFAAADLGFLLSFASTLGILVLSPKLNGFLSKRTEKIKQGFLKTAINGFTVAVCTTVSAVIFTFPITAVFFDGISTVSVLTNLVIEIPISILLVLSLIFLPMTLIPFLNFLSMPIAFLVGLSARFIIMASNFFASVKHAWATVNYPFVLVWAGVTAILIAVAIIIDMKYRLLVRALLLSVIIFFGGILSNTVAFANKPYVYITDSSNGLTAAIISGKSSVILSCGGSGIGGYYLERELEKKGVSDLKCMILPSLEKENSSGAVSVMGKYKPDMLIMPQEGKLGTQIEPHTTHLNVKPLERSTLQIDDFCEVEIEISQNGSVSLLLTVNNKTVLFLQSKANINQLSEKFLNADYIVCTKKVPGGLEERCTVLCSDEGNANLFTADYYTAHNKNITLIME